MEHIEAQPQYARYSVGIGHHIVMLLRLQTTQVELAKNGDTRARRRITDAFVLHLRTLGFFNSDGSASSHITYDQLTIIRK